ELAGRRFRAAAENGFYRVVNGQDGTFALWSRAEAVVRTMKKLRVLVLLHPEQEPPASPKGYSDQEALAWKTGYDVVKTLRATGHEVRVLGVQHELRPIRDEIETFKADVVFNLLEEFHGE